MPQGRLIILVSEIPGNLWVDPGESEVWVGEWPQQDILPWRSSSKVAIFLKGNWSLSAEDQMKFWETFRPYLEVGNSTHGVLQHSWSLGLQEETSFVHCNLQSLSCHQQHLCYSECSTCLWPTGIWEKATGIPCVEWQNTLICPVSYSNTEYYLSGLYHLHKVILL